MIANAFGVAIWIGTPILLVALYVSEWLRQRRKG